MASTNIQQRTGNPLLATVGLTLLLLLTALKPNPALAELDFPLLTGRIVDQAKLLNSENEAELEEILRQHEEETSDQMVVVTVGSLQGETINDFSNKLARHWGLGQAGKNNGVLLVIAPEQRKVRIEVGYGLEGQLTDATSSDIIQRHILPAFREDDYPGGIRSGVKKIIGAIKNEYKIEKPIGNRQEGFAQYFPLFFIALIVFFEILKKMGIYRHNNAGFPAAFVGIAVTAVKENLMFGFAASAVVFILIHVFGKKRSNSGTKGVRSNRVEDRPRRQNHQSGGSFRGGGGSFGGGGASGGW